MLRFGLATKSPTASRSISFVSLNQTKIVKKKKAEVEVQPEAALTPYCRLAQQENKCLVSPKSMKVQPEVAQVTGQ